MKAFDTDRDEVVERAGSKGIQYIINAGSDREGNEKGLMISRKYERVFSSVGIHPHDAKDLDEPFLKDIVSWIRYPKVVAVGEIGLDYHYMHSAKETQVEAFRRQIRIARRADLPLIVHSRDAEHDTLDILKDEAHGMRGVLHCFSGSSDIAGKAIEMGYYISFAGPITFKNAHGLREISRKIPDERLLIETDAPYLSPVPMRGKRNEPSFLGHTAQALAEARGVSLADIGRITTLNAMRLFGIGKVTARGEIAYRIRDSLYLNITNRCTNRCGFCVRFHTSFVKGHNLKLEREPSVEEVISAIGDPRRYREVVFCGLGEPFLRLELMKEVARWVKERGGKVRINTNGHGNAIHSRDVLPELRGIVDSISISLDAEDREKYEEICRPDIKDGFENVISFIKESKKYIPEVTVTVVSLPEINIDKCRDIAASLGVGIRIREFNVVG
jgi:TatD DNase family protein